MKIKTLLILLVSQLIFAQNHLEPVNSFFDVYNFQYEYYKKVRDKLFEGLTDKPKIRMVVFPSFEKEYVFQIEEDENNKANYFIIIKEPVEGSIWEIREGNPNMKINVKTYVSKISSSDVDILYNLFYSAIIKTQFRTDNMSGLDGISYYLSIWDYGLKSAEIWSPSDKKLKELIFIAETIVKKAKENKEVKFSEDLKNSIEETTKRFNKRLSHQEIEFLLKFNKSILEIENKYAKFMEVNDALSVELSNIYNDVATLVSTSGIYYATIDEIILESKQYFDIDFYGELEDIQIEKLENELQEDNPFVKLIEIYKKNL